MEFDYLSFDEENENAIMYRDYKQLKQDFHGTIITLFIPYDVSVVENVIKQESEDINILDILES